MLEARSDYHHNLTETGAVMTSAVIKSNAQTSGIEMRKVVSSYAVAAVPVTEELQGRVVAADAGTKDGV